MECRRGCKEGCQGREGGDQEVGAELAGLTAGNAFNRTRRWGHARRGDIESSFDGFVDLVHPLINRVFDGFVKVGGVGALHAAAQDSFKYLVAEEANKKTLEQLVQRIGKEAVQWGLVAGVYSGVTYGISEARGVHDWKNALLGGALTGAALSLTETNPCTDHANCNENRTKGAKTQRGINKGNRQVGSDLSERDRNLLGRSYVVCHLEKSVHMSDVRRKKLHGQKANCVSRSTLTSVIGSPKFARDEQRTLINKPKRVVNGDGGDAMAGRHYEYAATIE
ncbi:unnamed protein product [Calypogeia fissa]